MMDADGTAAGKPSCSTNDIGCSLPLLLLLLVLLVLLLRKIMTVCR